MLSASIEICPSCGASVSELRDDTGWCDVCSAPFIRLEYSRFEFFLLENADHIEHHMMRGLTFTAAIEKLRTEVRPTCASCGAVIKRGGRTTVFCRQTSKCRKAVRRYIYLYGKGMTKAQALSQVLEELNG